jgi:cell division protein FtsI/penicillin-binding protein 2
MREYRYPPLSPILGYNHPVYGQAGLEEALDPFLRGLSGQRTLNIWWSQLVYANPPPGLDVRLSLDLNLQRLADELLGDHAGALVLVKAGTGEILVMSSHPHFDPTHLDETWESLIENPEAPLLNRVTLGKYQPGAVLGPLLLAGALSENNLPELPTQLHYSHKGDTFDCAQDPVERTWGGTVAAGCPAPLVSLGKWMGKDRLDRLLADMGLYDSPALRLPTGDPSEPDPSLELESLALGLGELQVSPLQLSLAAAALSSDGIRPPSRLTMSVRNQNGDWRVLPPLSEARQALPALQADRAATHLSIPQLQMWQTIALAPSGDASAITWYLAGSNPGWEGPPLALALVLEEDNPSLAEEIGQRLFQAALLP